MIDYLLALLGGMFGAFIWMGLIRAAVRHRNDADLVAFKAMTFLLVVTTLLVEAFPRFATNGQMTPVIFIGYLIVMAWFWTSRRLTIVKERATNG